tara:strand:- start:48 stop:779 length:732 start_codon:yes stop_codon:yes gene_type:complete
MIRVVDGIEDWLEFGDNLIEKGEVKGYDNPAHYESIKIIKEKLISLKKSFESGQSIVAEEIKKHINSVINGIDKNVWKKWKSHIRDRKYRNRNKQQRINNETFEEINEIAEKHSITTKDLLNNINKKYYLIEKREKQYLDSLESLTHSERILFKSICKNLMLGINRGKKINLVAITMYARGDIPKHGNIYQFGSLTHKFEPTVKYTTKPFKKVLQKGSIIYLVEPLPRRILRLLVLLRQRYLN